MLRVGVVLGHEKLDIITLSSSVLECLKVMLSRFLFMGVMGVKRVKLMNESMNRFRK